MKELLIESDKMLFQAHSLYCASCLLIPHALERAGVRTEKLELHRRDVLVEHTEVVLGEPHTTHLSPTAALLSWTQSETRGRGQSQLPTIFTHAESANKARMRSPDPTIYNHVNRVATGVAVFVELFSVGCPDTL